MGVGKSSIDDITLTGKKNIFSCVYTVLLLCMGYRKNSVGTISSPKKKFSLLSTVLCMGLGKIQSRLDLHRKKKFVSYYNTTMVHGSWKKFNQTRPSPKRKKHFFLAKVLLWYMGLEKNSIGTRSLLYRHKYDRSVLC